MLCNVTIPLARRRRRLGAILTRLAHSVSGLWSGALQFDQANTQKYGPTSFLDPPGGVGAGEILLNSKIAKTPISDAKFFGNFILDFSSKSTW